MRCFRVACLIVVAASVLGTARQADAQSTRLPGRYQARPLTLTDNTIRLDVGRSDIGSLRSGTGADIGVLGPGTGWVLRDEPFDNAFFLSMGGGIGITEDFEFGATLVPLRLVPDTDYLNPELYGLYRFLKGQVELGLRFALALPVDDSLVLSVGPPLRVHLGELARLDTGIFLDMVFASDNSLNLRIPVQLAFQLTDAFFLGPEAGFWIFDLEEVNAMAGAFFGYTLGAPQEALGDLRLALRAPLADEVNAFEIAAAANFYFDI